MLLTCDTEILLRFWSKVVITPNGCWIWMAGVNASGYPLFAPDYAAGNRSARVFIYQQWVGPIADGGKLKSNCGNMRCVAPHHLTLQAKRNRYL